MPACEGYSRLYQDSNATHRKKHNYDNNKYVSANEFINQSIIVVSNCSVRILCYGTM